MTLQLGITNTDSSALDKSVTVTATKNIALRERQEIDELELEFEYDSNLLSVNYARINELGRNYFVKPSIVNNRVVLTLTEDYLTTWKNDIRNSVGHVIRSANKGNNYLVDGMANIYSSREVVTRKLGAGFTKEPTYLFTTSG